VTRQSKASKAMVYILHTFSFLNPLHRHAMPDFLRNVEMVWCLAHS
jgi:hypothetical protein